MMPAKSLWKPLLQRMVTGRWGRLRMQPVEPAFPEKLTRAGLYLHVPFCRNLCPFCPYNRVEYDEERFRQYERAVHEEIELYAPRLGECDFVSLYIGGGTPTVNMPGLLRMIHHLRERFPLSGDVCIELHPGNMDDGCLQLLKEAGVTMLSVGVESTSDRILGNIGRNHDGATALEALERAAQTGFEAVNADLMFALPGQTLRDWERDLQSVLACGADQVSTYPLSYVATCQVQ